jgi:branched-chain amino acid transport system permease protein
MTAASAPKGGVGERAAHALAESAVAGLVMFGLAFPILAWRTDTDPNNNLVLTPRWPLVAASVALVAAARLVTAFLAGWRSRALALCGLGCGAWSLWRLAAGARGPALFGLLAFGGVLIVAAFLLDNRLAAAPIAPPRSLVSAATKERLVRLLAAVAIIALFAFPLAAAHFLGPSGSLKWINNYGVQILIYVMLGWGLNIVVGLAGLLDLGYVAFYAVGAYSYALLSTTFGWSFWICLPLSGALAACWGLLLGFPVLRLRGDYLAIVTLAFGEIIRVVLINWTDLTNGYAGIASIPRITFFGLPFEASSDGFAARFGLAYSPIQRVIFLFYLILCLALLTNFFTLRLRRLPIGRAWEALREDEIACRSLGLNTVKTKLTAFALGAMFAGFAGSFFAVRQSFVSPDSFTFMDSATILAIVVLGGMGSQIGVALAATVMIGGAEILRDLDFLKQIFGQDFDPTQYRMLIFGAAMVLMMIWRPRGIVSTRRPSIFLREGKKVSAAFVGQGRG